MQKNDGPLLLRLMGKIGSVMFACLLVAACATGPEPGAREIVRRDIPAFDYPYDNPWIATVLRTPESQLAPRSEAPRRDATLQVFPDREVPEGFWYYRGLNYSYFAQPHPAPMIFMIAGTGADSRSGLMDSLGRILHHAGFHVVLLPSPTHSNFIVTASTTYLPGNGPQDAADLYRVMRMIHGELSRSLEITETHLAGYSLGAWHAAFTAKLDEEEKALNFQRVLLLSPPLSLYHSLVTVEQFLLNNLPGGIDSLDHFLDQAIQRIALVFQNTDAMDFSDEDYALQSLLQTTFGDERLAAAVGLSFRLASANMVFTADVMRRMGYVFPRDLPFRSTTPLGRYLGISLRVSFLDYFDDVFSAYYGGEPGLDLIEQSSLNSIGEYLSRSEKIGMLTSRDDIILGPGDLEQLQALFGERAWIFPQGGHLGSLEHRAVAAHLVNFFIQ